MCMRDHLPGILGRIHNPVCVVRVCVVSVCVVCVRERECVCVCVCVVCVREGECV